MQPHLIHHRRASLGLAVYGPFSRNRRRRRTLRTSRREATPAVLAAALLLSAALFLTAIFS